MMHKKIMLIALLVFLFSGILAKTSQKGRATEW